MHKFPSPCRAECHSVLDGLANRPTWKRMTGYLFNPRTQQWQEHFAIEEGSLRPLSSIGRATERLLKLNLPERVEIRETLMMTGRYPGVGQTGRKL